MDLSVDNFPFRTNPQNMVLQFDPSFHSTFDGEFFFNAQLAIVKETVSIKGELSVEEDLTIEGRVKGRIELKDHILWISPNGKVVDAQIHAGSVIIAGNVMGDISASEMVAIKSSGSMAGNIKCPRISIADGARFKGSIDTEAKADTTARPDLSKAALAHL